MPTSPLMHGTVTFERVESGETRLGAGVWSLQYAKTITVVERNRRGYIIQKHKGGWFRRSLIDRQYRQSDADQPDPHRSRNSHHAPLLAAQVNPRIRISARGT